MLCVKKLTKFIKFRIHRNSHESMKKQKEKKTIYKLITKNYTTLNSTFTK